MATRVDKTPGLSGIGESVRISRLRRKSPRLEGEANFIGLVRSRALSDLGDPAKARSNLFEKLSVLDQAEEALYGGPFNTEDWLVTEEFVDEGINTSYLSQLANTSTGSFSPRIRISDRIAFANSFFGEGSVFGLHSGPDAQFYRSDGIKLIGTIQFNFTGTSIPNAPTILDESDNPIPPSTLLDGLPSVTISITGYNLNGQFVSLYGSGISLKLVSPSTWTIDQGADKLTTLKSTFLGLGITDFSQVKFQFGRPYSSLNLPEWFTESPNTTPHPADDSDPATSFRVLNFTGGVNKPVVEPGYWYSKSSVEERWSAGELSRIGSNAIVEDSNMEWKSPPKLIKTEIYNWGIRWDGYLRITPGIYAFQVQTNVDVKIDLAIGSGGVWQNVFDSRSNSAKESEDFYISSSSFNTDNVDGKFKYVTGASWVGYVPITIRLFRGGPEEGVNVPLYPNLFIKTTTLSAAKSYYAENHIIEVASGGGVTGSTLSRVVEILGDSNAAVTYQITAQGDNIFVNPVPIVSISTDGTTVTLSDPVLDPGTYTLKITPNRSGEFNNNRVALWKNRIASPSPIHETYADLVDGSFTPDQEKVAFDSRPDWWKITKGHPYNESLTISDQNTPLDGLVPNSFKSALSSGVPGLGQYGAGVSRGNIIIGEERYGTSYSKGSNYTGILLEPNRLGEGGKLIINAKPINNATFDDGRLLSDSDLGGNGLTGTSVTERVAKMYLFPNSNLYLLHEYDNGLNLTADDDPTIYGLPPFTSPAWLSPITISVTSTSDTENFSGTVNKGVAPLSMTVEKLPVSQFTVLLFSTTLASITSGGSEVGLFHGNYVKFYVEKDLPFKHRKVDTGEGLCFSDVLKYTYNGSNFNDILSEVAKPESDQVTPFGFDTTPGRLCYPPYFTSNPLLSSTAVDDGSLYGGVAANRYDVFWGDQTKLSDLGGKTLTILEKLEFDVAVSAQKSAVIVSLSESELADSTLDISDYTHRLRVDIPLESTEPDVTEFIGNGESVKDSYFLYVKLD